jgi:hypothetical protein
MKANVKPHDVLFREIDDAIDHSQKEGLPLESIELTEEEWELFCWAFEHYKKASSLLQTSVNALRKYNQTRYRGIRIYKEKT